MDTLLDASHVITRYVRGGEDPGLDSQYDEAVATAQRLAPELVTADAHPPDISAAVNAAIYGREVPHDWPMEFPLLPVCEPRPTPLVKTTGPQPL